MFASINKYMYAIFLALCGGMLIIMLLMAHDYNKKLVNLKTVNNGLVAQHSADQGSISVLKDTVKNNETMYQTSLTIATNAANIAAAEARAAQARAVTHRSIQDAIVASPPSTACSRSPVIGTTIDQLWPDPKAGRTNSVQDQSGGSAAGSEPTNLPPPASPSGS